MNRRKFVKTVGAGTLAAGLTACSRDTVAPSGATAATPFKPIKWKMVTTWPENFPGLGTGANHLASIIGKMSGGRLTVKVFGAGQMVPAFETFDTVSRGTAQMGHGGAYYWKGKAQATQFFGAVPFGMNAQEMNGWLYYGGGLELWREVYAPFNLLPFPIGHSGTQMGGWFNREINRVEDLEGLKMRIPGLGGEVLKRAGGTPVNLPGGELFTALQTGAIDATEWVGPYNDLAFGLYRAAKYYYYPGWHEPDATLECIVNRDAFESLPADLQAIVSYACEAAGSNMLAEFTARNNRALSALVNEHGVQLRPFPPAVLQRLRQLTGEVLDELAASDPQVARVYGKYKEFLDSVRAWHKVSEQAYYAAR